MEFLRLAQKVATWAFWCPFTCWRSFRNVDASQHSASSGSFVGRTLLGKGPSVESVVGLSRGQMRLTSRPLFEGQAWPPCQEWVICSSASLLWCRRIRVCGRVVQHSVNPPFYMASMFLNFWNNFCGFLSASPPFSTSHTLVTPSPGTRSFSISPPHVPFCSLIHLLGRGGGVGGLVARETASQDFSVKCSLVMRVALYFQVVAMEKACLLLALLYVGMFLGSTLRMTLNLHPLSSLLSLSYISKFKYAFFGLKKKN